MNTTEEAEPGVCDVLGNVILCDSGIYFSLDQPKVSDVRITDIAASLSKICRFGGHCRVFYSVAEHSCHSAQIALDDGHSMECVMAVFLHDAAEAYVGDMTRPLKNMLPEFKVIENRIAKAIEECFGVDFEKWHSVIREIDMAMLMAERRRLFPSDGMVWTGEPEARFVLPCLRFDAPETSRQGFLRMWKYLCDINKSQ